MALLGPIIGNGRIIGPIGIWRPTTVVDDVIISAGFNIEIGFYSPSGEYVGSVQTNPDGAGFINFSITEERIGGLNNFDFEIDRDIDIPFYPLLECRFFVFGNLWYTGELIYQPTQDKSDSTYQYSGNGYAEYLKRIKINKTYTNATIEEILKDIIFYYVIPDSRILYNSSLIQPPVMSVSKFEIKNKDIWNTLERLLEITNYNYNIEQYTFGVDENRHFYFKKINTDINYGFFEGFQYQQPETKEDFKKVINQILIYRTKENSQETEFVTTVNNMDSQAKYGLKSASITIPIYLDTISAIRIANAILSRKEQPFTSLKIKNIEAEIIPFPIEFYYLNNKINNYKTIIAEFELLKDWTYNINNTIITTTTSKVLSGKNSFQCLNKNGSKTEYIEKEFTEEINFPRYIDLWLAQEKNGKYIKLFIWDTFNNLQTTELDIKVTNDFTRMRINISLDNIKKIRIEFIRNEENTIYLDRLESVTETYYRHNLILDKITYKLDRSKLLANIEFGEKIDTLVDKIKKIKDLNDNIFDVMEKS